ncbi:MAG: PRC-barrel domain-containing protein [Alphaproteobacteria bacterium]
MKRLLLSTSAAVLVLGLSTPALANTDCMQEIRNLETRLEQSNLQQTEMDNINSRLDRARNAENSERCMTIVNEIEEEYASADMNSDMGGDNNQRMVMQQGNMNARVMVEQEDPQVDVTQAPPQVDVTQPQPQVDVAQPEPEVIVNEAKPEITVKQPAPDVLVEQDEPEVTVRIPDPNVNIDQEDVQVSVRQPEPEVSVEQSQPNVRIVQPQPEITTEKGEAQIDIDQGEAQVNVADADDTGPRVNVDKANQAEVEINKARPQVDVQRVGDADIRYESAEPSVNIESESGNEMEMADSSATQDYDRKGTDTGSDNQMQNSDNNQQGNTYQQAESDWEQDDSDMQNTDMSQSDMDQSDMSQNQIDIVTADEIIGLELVNQNGAEIGEVEDIVYGSDQTYYVVVAQDTFLGLSEELKIIPLNQVQHNDNQLVAMTYETSLTDDYIEAQYTSVDSDFEMQNR